MDLTPGPFPKRKGKIVTAKYTKNLFLVEARRPDHPKGGNGGEMGSDSFWKKNKRERMGHGREEGKWRAGAAVSGAGYLSMGVVFL